MTKPASELIALADRFETKQTGWLPITGHCRNITFTLNECDQIAQALRTAANQSGSERAGVDAPFQSRVRPWMLACFGPVIPFDKTERNHRFLEEAIELVQSLGCTRSEAHQLVDYVYGRPEGEPNQEVGGVMVTLAALCLANDLDMAAAGETELARIWTKVEKIRAKQAAKPKHSPLPEAPSTHGTPDEAVRSDALADLYYAIGGLAALAAIGCDEVGRMTGDHVAVTQSMERRRDDALAALHSPKIAAAETKSFDGSKNLPSTRRLDDLGSVQDGRKMSTDGHRADAGNTSDGERLPLKRVTAGETAPSISGDVLAMKEACKRVASEYKPQYSMPAHEILVMVETRTAIAAAIDRIDVKAEAKSQEPEAGQLSVREFREDAFRSMEVQICGDTRTVQFGVEDHGGDHPTTPCCALSWTDAADLASWVQSCITHPTTKPEAPAVSVDAETIEAAARIIDPDAFEKWDNAQGNWRKDEARVACWPAEEKATRVAALIAGGR